MTQADKIRQFALKHYIAAARSEGRTEITVRAGDIHKRMALHNAMPAVCSALGGSKLRNLATVALHDRTGPRNGANVYFTFNLKPDTTTIISTATKSLSNAVPALKMADLDLATSLVLISCVKSKLPYDAPAREIYTSAWFSMTRNIVESSGACWFLLSSLYGLVDPDKKIAPYDFTLNKLGIAERRAWASKVLVNLLPQTKGYSRVVIFAGERYREFLINPLKRNGLDVIVPMAGLRRGEQLAWLSERT